jgi:hypothetical protein
MHFSVFHAYAVLPLLSVQAVALHVGWTLVIAAAVVSLLKAFPIYLRIAGVGLAVALNFLPASLTPSGWLGLAFQSPSLTLQAFCLLSLLRAWRARHVPPVDAIGSQRRWPNGLLIVITLLGWVLLLDLLAVFNVSVYAMGFTAQGLLVALLVAAGLQIWSLRSQAPDASARLRDAATLIVAAMAVHLLLRLPSGNAWDALIDPWLWLGAQALLMSRAVVWIALLARAAARRLVQWVRA